MIAYFLFGFLSAFGMAASAESPSISLTQFQIARKNLKSYALQKNPDLQISLAHTAQSRSHAHTLLTRWLPRVDLQLSQARYHDFALLPQSNTGSNPLSGSTPTNLGQNIQDFDQSRWALMASFPLYRRPTYLEWQIGQQEVDLFTSQQTAQLRELERKTDQALGHYVIQLYKLNLLTQSLQIAKNQAREVQIRFDLGQKTKIDLLKAQANLLHLESRVALTEQARISALQRLLEFLALSSEEFEQFHFPFRTTDPSEIAAFLTTLTDTLPLQNLLAPYLSQGIQVDSPSEALLQRLLEHSTSFQKIQHQHAVNELRAKLLFAPEWPELTLRGSMGKVGDTWSQALGDAQLTHSISLVLTVPLFSFGGGWSSFREQTQAQAQNEMQTQVQLRQLQAETIDLKNQFLSLQKSLFSLEKNVEQHAEIVKLSQKSMELGKMTLQDLLTSQNLLLETQIQLGESRFETWQVGRRLADELGL